MKIFLSKITRTRIILATLFLIFLIVNFAYLNRVPGLVGDEGYEGLSVTEHIKNLRNPILGRESYVSFWVDYFRIPFVLLFGFSTLALRIPMIIASLAMFWLTWIVLKRIFGEYFALFGLIFFIFSPAFILYQRISWPINFLPLFALLTLESLTSKRKNKVLTAGLAAGFGTSTHFVFFPFVLSLIISALLLKKIEIKKIFSYWTFIVSFLAGFGIQLAILITYGVESSRMGGGMASYASKIISLISSIPIYFSGTIYFSELIGTNFPTLTILTLSILIFLISLSLLLKPKRREAALWLLCLGIFVLFETYIVNYFHIRYFHLAVLAIWALAGIGLGKLLVKYFANKKVFLFSPFFVSLILILLTVYFAFIPYLKFEGSTKIYADSGVSYDSAGHSADIKPLVDCIDKLPKTVYAAEPKIQNRLLFLANGNPNIKIAEKRSEANLFIDYRGEGPGQESKSRNKEMCPELNHFIVIPNNDFQKN